MDEPVNQWVIRTDDMETRLPSLSKVADLLRTRRLSAVSQIYDPERNIWRAVSEFEHLRPKLKAAARLRNRAATSEAFVAGAGYAFVAAIIVIAFQLFVYLREGEWPGASLYDLAAFNLPEVTAKAVGLPQLAVMREVHATLPPVADFRGNVAETNRVRMFYSAAAEYAQISSDLRPLHLYLVAPTSWFGVHAAVTEFLRKVSVAGILILIALLLAGIGSAVEPNYDAWDELDNRSVA